MYTWFPNELLNKCKRCKIQLAVMKVPQVLWGLKLLLHFTDSLLGQALFDCLHLKRSLLVFFFLSLL